MLSIGERERDGEMMPGGLHSTAKTVVPSKRGGAAISSWGDPAKQLKIRQDTDDFPAVRL